VVFEADYDEIKLQNYSYNIISVTSSPLRHRKCHQNNVTKIFSNLSPSNQNFWKRQWRCCLLYPYSAQNSSHKYNILMSFFKLIDLIKEKYGPAVSIVKSWLILSRVFLTYMLCMVWMVYASRHILRNGNF